MRAMDYGGMEARIEGTTIGRDEKQGASRGRSDKGERARSAHVDKVSANKWLDAKT